MKTYQKNPAQPKANATHVEQEQDPDQELDQGLQIAPPAMQLKARNKSQRRQASNTSKGISQRKNKPIQRNDDDDDQDYAQDINAKKEDPKLTKLKALGALLFNTSHVLIPQFQQEMEAIRPVLTSTLGQIGINYTAAWTRHTGILNQAGADAADENMMRGIVIGAAASVAIAAGIGAIPALAFAELSAKWFMVQGVSAMLSSAGGTYLTSDGTFTAPTGFRSSLPANLAKLNQLSQLLNFERKASRAYLINSAVIRQSSYMDQIIRDYETGQHNFSKEADAFIKSEAKIKGIFNKYSKAVIALRQFKSKIQHWEAPDDRRIEKAIWIKWIADLPLSKHDLLDRNALENYLLSEKVGVLGTNGELKVDTAKIFDTKEEKQAILNARAKSRNLQDIMRIPTY